MIVNKNYLHCTALLLVNNHTLTDCLKWRATILISADKCLQQITLNWKNMLLKRREF